MIGIIIIYVIEILFWVNFKRTQPFVSLKSIQWHSIHGKRSPTVPNSCSSLPFSSHGQSEDCMIILSFATNFLWHLIGGFSVRSNIFCKLINLFTSHPLFLLENGFTFVEWMVIWKKRHWLYLRLVKYKKYFKLQGCQGCSVVSGSFSVCLIGPNTFLCTELLKELKRRKREQLGVSC